MANKRDNRRIQEGLQPVVRNVPSNGEQAGLQPVVRPNVPTSSGSGSGGSGGSGGKKSK